MIAVQLCARFAQSRPAQHIRWTLMKIYGSHRDTERVIQLPASREARQFVFFNQSLPQHTCNTNFVKNMQRFLRMRERKQRNVPLGMMLKLV